MGKKLSCAVVESALFRSTPALVHIETHALGSRRLFFLNIYFYGMLQWKSAVVQLSVSPGGQSRVLYTAQCCCAAERGGEGGGEGDKDAINEG